MACVLSPGHGRGVGNLRFNTLFIVAMGTDTSTILLLLVGSEYSIKLMHLKAELFVSIGDNMPLTLCHACA